jgi:eukaryotic-like serine/threonine-protein kinase
MSLQTGQRLGGFEILGPLGAGGMGEVYRARDTRLGREVALKVLPESLAADKSRLARFEQEARAASALNHPNIVSIFEIGREGETTFIAMELVEGRTLRSLTLVEPMPVRKLLGVASQIADGLAKAHAAGIVHRDLKPENVMLSKDGFAKILDFGLAKLSQPQPEQLSGMPTAVPTQTVSGMVLGTVAYMSPEQAMGQPLDYRSDQFSMGSMLYEMSTGKKAFERTTSAETMSAIIREEPEPVGELRPDLPLPVRWILERCMAKDPEDRYASTRDLSRDLSSLRDRLSEASSGATALLSPPARRQRRIAGLASVVALAFVVGVAGWWIARQTTRKAPAVPTFKRLSFQSGTLGNARFTPNGDIVYGLHPTGSSVTRLYLTRLESPESKLFDFAGDVLSISKSGDLAIYQSPTPGGISGTLAVVPLVGGAPRPLAEGVVWGSADWDPAGKDLAIVRDTGNGLRLEFPIGKVLIAQDLLGGLRFSPDGREIVLSKIDGELAVADRNGKFVRTLASGWKIAGVPCWADGGREVWFAGSKAQAGEGMFSLWAVNRSGTLRPLARVPGSLELYDVSPDGRALLAHHTVLHSLRALAAGNASEMDLSWLDKSWPSDLSADGKTILITEDGEGTGGAPSMYLRTTDGAPAVRIGNGTGMAVSPGGQWVLGRTEQEGKSQFVLIPTGAGETRSLAFEGLDVRWGAFTPDGKKIVFDASSPTKTSRVYIADISGGSPTSVGPPGLSFQLFTNPVSPDGRRAVGVRDGKVVVFSLDGSSEPRELPGLVAGRDQVNQWSADSRSVYLYSVETRPLQVELFDVDTGKRRPWRQIPVESAAGGIRLRITPDGRFYAYRSQGTFSELYLVEGLR